MGSSVTAADDRSMFGFQARSALT